MIVTSFMTSTYYWKMTNAFIGVHLLQLVVLIYHDICRLTLINLDMKETHMVLDYARRYHVSMLHTCDL